jgi:predicted ATP-grasp superfamily ATP-dependent carboligase
MKRVFVFEYLTGGGLIDGDEAAVAELLPLGLTMRDALVADLAEVPGVVVSAAVSARAPQFPANTQAVQAEPGESSFDFVARQAALHDVAWVVAPETGGLLAAFQRLVGEARWLGCSAEAITIAASKSATLLALARHGITTPLAFEHALRWVVKPDDGAGAVATRVHTSRSAAQADAAQRQGGLTALEPWVEGDALSVSLRCSGAGAELLSVNRQQIHIGEHGSVGFRGVAPGSPHDRSRLAAVAEQVVRALPGLRGFVGIDLVWHAQRGPVVIEVNPRVTVAYAGLSAALNRNLAAELLADHEARAAHA